MQMTDEVRWRYVYDRNGSLRTQSMGRTRVGKWSIQKDELCLDLGDGPDSGCFEVWLSGGNVDVRPTGLGLPCKALSREQLTAKRDGEFVHVQHMGIS